MVATSSTAPTADRPVVVCDVAHPQDACVQFFGSDGNIRAARVTVMGVRPVLENGQLMPLVQAFEQLEREQQQRLHTQVWTGQAAVRWRVDRQRENYERHGDPSPWHGDEEEKRETDGITRLRVEMVQPPVIK